MKKRFFALALAMLMTAQLFGCRPAASEATMPTETAEAAATAAEQTAAPGEEGPWSTLESADADTRTKNQNRVAQGYEPFLPAADDAKALAVVPSVPSYTVAADFSNVTNFDQFAWWNEEEEAKNLLQKNGFFLGEASEYEFFSRYENNRYLFHPNFVTVDSMMHTYHLYFSYLMKQVEQNTLSADLLQLSQVMQAQSMAQYNALRGTEWEAAALRNVAFFSVGVCLQQPDAQVPADAQALVSAELAQISAAEGPKDSPLLSFDVEKAKQEDYSQYKPRGYYTSNEELSHYFQVMMWYGRMCFLQKENSHSRSALLMTLGLVDSTALQNWEEIYSLTSFFAGTSDDPGIYQYAPLIQAAYGGWPEVSQLSQKTEEWQAFLAAVQQLAPPAINSLPLEENLTAEERAEKIQGFRLMGQRFTLDAAIFQNLTAPAVDENAQAEKRLLPAGLDVPAAFGSDTALDLLVQDGAGDYPGYNANMEKLRTAVKAADAETWQASLYAGWLNTLRPLAEQVQKRDGYPQFMQSEAWDRHKLTSFLGSWAELKHDTVLYAKQSYSEMGGGGPIDEYDDRGYVEPEPVVFARLKTLCAATKDGLSGYDALNDTMAKSLQELSDLAAQLETISIKELQNEGLTEEEYELIRSYGGQLEHFWYESLSDRKPEEQILENNPAAIISDVATDPNGRVLEAGTGLARSIYVIVNVEGSLRIAEGVVYSYYEFPWPLNDRLTDEQWRAMNGVYSYVDAAAGTIPALPEEPDWQSDLIYERY